MASIKSMGFERLRNNELFEIFQRTHNLGTALLTQKDDAEVLATYKRAIDQFDDALNQDNDFKDTKAVRSSDERVNELYRGFKHYLRSMLLCPDNTKRLLAKDAMFIIDKYGRITNLPYNQKYGILHNSMQELNELPEETQTSLSLSMWLEGLNEAIKQFLSAREAQTAEKGAYQVGLVKNTRRIAEKAHRNFIRIINAFALTFGEENYASFINQVNTIISDAQTLSKARATRAERDNNKEEDVIDTNKMGKTSSVNAVMPTEVNEVVVEECNKAEMSGSNSV